MLNRLKHTLKHTFVYSLGNLGTKLIGLILLPLYTEYLSTGEYGMLAILESTTQFLVAIFGFRLYVAMMRWWSDEEKKDNQKKIVFSAFITTVLLALVVLMIITPLKSELSRLFFGSKKFSSYFFILAFWVSFELIGQISISMIRLREKSIFFVTVFIAKLLIILFSVFYFLTVEKLGVEGVILAQLIGTIFIFLITLPFLIKEMKLVVGFHLIAQFFKYGAPLIFSTISVLMLTLGDRYLLTYYKNYSDVGIYSLGYKIAGVLNVTLLMSFQMGFMPIAFKMYNKPNAQRFFSKVLTYFVFILLLSALILSLYSKEVIILFSPGNKDFWTAYKIVPLLCLTYILKGIEYVFLMGFHIAKKTTYNAVLIMVGATANLGLNMLFIPLMGMYGAATTSIISEFIVVMLYYRYSIKFYPVHYEIVKILKMFFTASLVFGISFFIVHLGLIIGLFLKLLLLASFPLILYILNFYERIELQRMKEFWHKWKNPKKWGEYITEFKIDTLE